jgi:hypothetical protein
VFKIEQTRQGLAAQRGALEMAATQLLTRIGIDAPGLRGRADPATPTARPAAAPSTETAAPGDILIFLAPVNGWAGQDDADTGSGVR